MITSTWNRIELSIASTFWLNFNFPNSISLLKMMLIDNSVIRELGGIKPDQVIEVAPFFEKLI
jgi:hypothetical protein